jgi:hypothetical protein
MLGLWLAAGLCVYWMERQNLRHVDLLLSGGNPNVTVRLKPLGVDARSVLLYQASEQNRYHRHKWENLQLLLGTAFFLTMLFGSREDKFVLLGIVGLLGMVALQRFLITPEIDALGRLLDFAPQDQMGTERNRRWVLEKAALGVEAVKWGVALLLTARMVFSRKRSGRSRDARRQFDRVDKANHRGVNW